MQTIHFGLDEDLENIFYERIINTAQISKLGIQFCHM